MTKKAAHPVGPPWRAGVAYNTALLLPVLSPQPPHSGLELLWPLWHNPNLFFIVKAWYLETLQA